MRGGSARLARQAPGNGHPGRLAKIYGETLVSTYAVGVPFIPPGGA